MIDDDDDIYIEGVATEFEKFFSHGKDGSEAWLIKSGAFDDTRGEKEVRLLLDHDETASLGGTGKRLELHYGKDSVAFRFRIGKSSDFDHMVDEYDSYFGVSIGFKTLESQRGTIEGVPVLIIEKATLTELSILKGAPAVDSTFGRFVSAKHCQSLRDDYDDGHFSLVGRFISLHRKVESLDNDGKITYKNITTPYDHAANQFQRALSRCQELVEQTPS
jgi:phage head maturation protease